MTTPRDQPSKVSTQDIPKAPDKAVVTSDTPPEVDDSGEEDPKAAAAAGDPPGSNDQEPAPGAKKRKPRRDRNAERKLKKAHAALGEASRENEANAARITELENQVEVLTAATPKAPEPKLDDFKTPQEYAKAFAKWETAGKPAATAKPPAKTATAPPASTDPPPADEEILDFRKRGKVKLGDEFVEALQETDNACNQLMGEFMFDSEYGPEIYVHLANNQDEARKIYDASSRRATKALDALAVKAKAGELDVGEGQLDIDDPPDLGDHDTGGDSPPAGSRKKSAKRKATKAPTPPSDTKPGGTTDLKPDPENEDMDDYAARRAKEEMAKQGRYVN